MIINGKNAVLEALQANHPLSEIVISDTRHYSTEHNIILNKAKEKKVTITELPAPLFKRRYGTNSANGIIAISNHITINPLSLCLDAPSTYPTIVILDHLEDPYNMGAIIRTCDGLGANALIFSKDRQVKLTPGVINASAGAAYYLPLIQVNNIANAITQLKAAGYWIYGTDVNTGNDISTTHVNSPFALVIGNEHKGVSKRVSKMVDLTVHLPMQGHMDSLNVSVATGIILYTLLKK